jgi:hypothetical protein
MDRWMTNLDPFEIELCIVEVHAIEHRPCAATAAEYPRVVVDDAATQSRRCNV